MGVFSVMWIDDYSSDLGMAAARCEYLKPGWMDMRWDSNSIYRVSLKNFRNFVFRNYTSVRPQTLATRSTHEGTLLPKFQVTFGFPIVGHF